MYLSSPSDCSVSSTLNESAEGIQTFSSLHSANPVLPGLNLTVNVLSSLPRFSPDAVKVNLRASAALTSKAAPSSFHPNSSSDAGSLTSTSSLRVNVPVTIAFPLSSALMLIAVFCREACFGAVVKLNLKFLCSLSVEATFER